MTIGKVVRDFRAALPDAAIYVYDNNSTDRTAEIAAAPDMVAKVLEGYDMVIGDRLSSTYFQENKRPFHNFGNRLVRGSINHLFRAHSPTSRPDTARSASRSSRPTPCCRAASRSRPR